MLARLGAQIVQVPGSGVVLTVTSALWKKDRVGLSLGRYPVTLQVRQSEQLVLAALARPPFPVMVSPVRSKAAGWPVQMVHLVVGSIGPAQMGWCGDQEQLPRSPSACQRMPPQAEPRYHQKVAMFLLVLHVRLRPS